MLDDTVTERSFGDAASADPELRRVTPFRVALSHGLHIRMVDGLELILVTKTTPGLTEPQIDVLQRLVEDIAAGHVGPCKFLVFDLAGQGVAPNRRSPQLESLMGELSNLIFQVPVVSIAWARQDVSGADLGLALACSMLVGETEASLTFDLDLVDNLTSYALLAHKLGFVQAERLMEGAAVVDAAAAHDLMILNSVVPAGEGLDGIRKFVASRMRRHNSACGLYRAQRITMLHAA